MAKKPGKKKIAALPLRRHKKHGLQICLITSRKQGFWIIPTGKPEKKLKQADVAQLETYEEAGLLGRAKKKQSFRLLSFSMQKGIQRDLTLYPLKVRKELKRWPESRERRRKWVSVSKLDHYLSDKILARKIIQRLR